MNIRASIQELFDGKAFDRPLFYNIPSGLRFELSEGGDWVDQFDVALKKSREICSEIFQEEFTLCIRIYGGKSLLSVLSVIRELRDIDLYPAQGKEHWSELVEDDGDWPDANDRWHTIAFKLPTRHIAKALWCAMATDIMVKPCPRACFYLFDLDKGVEVFPYDDRGMDVIGKDTDLLQSLYNKFNSYLLDYDREAMDASFAKKALTNAITRNALSCLRFCKRPQKRSHLKSSGVAGVK